MVFFVGCFFYLWDLFRTNVNLFIGVRRGVMNRTLWDAGVLSEKKGDLLGTKLSPSKSHGTMQGNLVNSPTLSQILKICSLAANEHKSLSDEDNSVTKLVHHRWYVVIYADHHGKCSWLNFFFPLVCFCHPSYIPQGSNHLLRVAMEPKYLSEEVILYTPIIIWRSVSQDP